MQRRGIVDNSRIPEREVAVKASYTDIIKPALEHCMKGCAFPRKTLPQIQRRTGVNGVKRTVSMTAVN